MKEREAISESTMRSGYVRITFRGGAQEYKHRLVMEEILGRKLDRLECVHHINGNKGDNEPSNLELMYFPDHVRMHVREYRRPPRTGGVVTCRICGKSRYYTPKALGRVKNQGEYRCQQCYYRTMHRAQDMGYAVEKPT